MKIANKLMHDVLEYHSEWVGNSQLRLRIRKIGKNEIVVDVTELSHGRICREGAALKVARKRVAKHGVSNMEAVVLCDYRADKKATRLDGTVSLVKIRQSSFAFKGNE